MKTPLRSLSALGQFLLWLVWFPWLQPVELGAEDEPLTLTLVRYDLYDLEYKSVGLPDASLPDFSVPAGVQSIPFNVAVAGDLISLSGAALTVSLPATVDAVPGTIPGTVILDALGVVRFNATWVAEEGGEYLANCLVDDQGDGGFHFLDEQVSLTLPLTGANTDVLQMGFAMAEAGFYNVFVEFTTGSSGGFFRGKMQLIFSSDGTPIQVDSLEDGDDGNYAPGEQTMREAMKRALTKDEAVAVPVLVDGKIKLQEKLEFSGANPNLVTFVAMAGEVEVSPQLGATAIQLLTVAAGQRLEFFGVRFYGEVKPSPPLAALENSGWLRMEHGRIAVSTTTGALHTKSGGTTILRNCSIFSVNPFPSVDYRAALINEGALEAVNCAIFDQFTAVVADGTESRFEFCTLGGLGSSMVVASGKTANISHCVIGRWGNHSSQESNLSGNLPGLHSGGCNVIHLPGTGYQAHQRDILGKDIGMQLSPVSFYILPWSPAINQGDPNFDPADFDPPLDKDVLGRARPSGRVDIGALEARDSAEYKALLLELLLENDGQGAAEDVNGNGTSDLLDVLTGIDPSEGGFGHLPAGAAPASSPAAAPEVPEEPAILPAGSEGELFADIELRLDERMDFGEFTVQTSNDLQSWQDRATYRALGSGQGYSRTAVVGAELEDSDLSGFVWFLRERVPWNGGSFNVRLRGQLLPTP